VSVPGRAWLLVLAVLWLAFPASAGRLEQVKARGYLVCGVYPGVAGFATVSKDGRYSGFDVDICRAVAAAIFGVPDKVKFIPAPGVVVFKRVPEPDLVVRRLTWTLTREEPLGLMFGPIVYYDGQGFLVPRASGIASAPQIAGKRICVDAGEDWLANLMRYSRAKNLDFKPVVVTSRKEGEEAFFEGRCAAYSADKTMLGAIRADASAPGDYAILSEQISKEPLAPLVRAGDDRFFQVVRWTVFALIEAEELGVTSKNIGEMRAATDPDIRALLGVVPGNGKALGLSESWAADAIRAVGNYGEVFARNVGDAGGVGLDRGLNRLWTDGGLIYAPPVR
jgi:general L-amino acid transport system substrate-binding protein